MAKHDNRHVSKKGLKGLIRVTNTEGKRVWKYRGEEFSTLRDVRSKYPL
jgi:hypothetical protein